LQSIDVDIGAGVNFAVPPTNQVWVDLLVPNPDPASIDLVHIPPTIPRDALRSVEYITTVSCKVTCVSSPAANRACLTRLLYLGPDALGPNGSVGVRSQDVLVPRGTKYVEVFVGQSGTGGPGTDPVVTPPELLLRWETVLFRPPPASPVNFPVPLPDLFLDVFPSARFQLRGESAAAQWQTGRVVYPGLYNAIRARLENFEKRAILTFKFTLDV
jgi:hypothetical protein